MPEVERYVIRMRGDIEANVRRKAKQIGWPPERIERKFSQNADLTDLENLEKMDVTVSPVYDNTEDGAIEKIKGEVKLLSGL